MFASTCGHMLAMARVANASNSKPDKKNAIYPKPKNLHCHSGNLGLFLKVSHEWQSLKSLVSQGIPAKEFQKVSYSALAAPAPCLRSGKQLDKSAPSRSRGAKNSSAAHLFARTSPHPN